MTSEKEFKEKDAKSDSRDGAVSKKNGATGQQLGNTPPPDPPQQPPPTPRTRPSMSQRSTEIPIPMKLTDSAILDTVTPQELFQAIERLNDGRDEQEEGVKVDSAEKTIEREIVSNSPAIKQVTKSRMGVVFAGPNDDDNDDDDDNNSGKQKSPKASSNFASPSGVSQTLKEHLTPSDSVSSATLEFLERNKRNECDANSNHSSSSSSSPDDAAQQQSANAAAAAQQKRKRKMTQVQSQQDSTTTYSSSVSSGQRRIDSAAASVTRDAVAHGAAEILVDDVFVKVGNELEEDSSLSSTLVSDVDAGLDDSENIDNSDDDEARENMNRTGKRGDQDADNENSRCTRYSTKGSRAEEMTSAEQKTEAKPAEAAPDPTKRKDCQCSAASKGRSEPPSRNEKSKNVSIADSGRTSRAASVPTSGRSSAAGSICTRYSVKSQELPSEPPPRPSVPQPPKKNEEVGWKKAKDKCSIYSVPKTKKEPPKDQLKSAPTTPSKGSEAPQATDVKPLDSNPPRAAAAAAAAAVDDEDDGEGMGVTNVLMYGLGALGLLALLSRLAAAGGGGGRKCLPGRYGLPLKVTNISSDCEMPLRMSLTASNCYLGAINVAKKKCNSP